MARRKKAKAVKATKKVAALAAVKPPKSPAKKPTLKFGSLAEANQFNPIIKNFSQVLHWLYTAFGPCVFDTNKPEYFDEEDMTIPRTVNGSKMVDDVLNAWKDGKKPIVKCGSFQYTVGGIVDDVETGKRAFSCTGAALSGDTVKIASLVVVYDPETGTSTSQFIVA